MSQFWHAHWAEDAFIPKRLQNWQVPRWHPEWPLRHCTTTKFEAHKNGRLFASAKGPKSSWSDFKGTWELPLKIDRKTAEKLSQSTEYKKWKAYEKRRKLECLGKCKETAKKSVKKQVKKNTNENEKEKEEKHKDDTKEENLKTMEDIFKDKCKVSEACKL